MTVPRGCASVLGVAAPSLKTFTLTIDPASEPIAGRLEDEHAYGRDFVGWLGLASALEQLLSSPPPDEAGP